jgi:uncharacterized membrane protein
MPLAPDFDREEREVEFSRALAFSDGVFAFAITLLVTTIEVPSLRSPQTEHDLLVALKDLAGPMGSYFLSFAIIGLFWLRHHRLFARVRRLDGRALVLNLLVLSFVVLMPFSTEIIGKYGDLPAGTAVYALNLALASFAFTLLWSYCVRHDMLDEHPTPRQLRLELWMRLSVSLLFLVSLPIAFVSTSLAQLSWFGLIVVQRAIMRHYADEGRIAEDEED